MGSFPFVFLGVKHQSVTFLLRSAPPKVFFITECVYMHIIVTVMGQRCPIRSLIKCQGVQVVSRCLVRLRGLRLCLHMSCVVSRCLVSLLGFRLCLHVSDVVSRCLIVSLCLIRLLGIKLCLHVFGGLWVSNLVCNYVFRSLIRCPGLGYSPSDHHRFTISIYIYTYMYMYIDIYYIFLVSKLLSETQTHSASRVLSPGSDAVSTTGARSFYSSETLSGDLHCQHSNTTMHCSIFSFLFNKLVVSPPVNKRTVNFMRRLLLKSTSQGRICFDESAIMCVRSSVDGLIWGEDAGSVSSQSKGLIVSTLTVEALIQVLVPVSLMGQIAAFISDDKELNPFGFLDCYSLMRALGTAALCFSLIYHLKD